MQTGKLRRTVCKLQQLRDDFYAFRNAGLTLWMVQRAEDNLRKRKKKLPPGLNSVYRLFTVEMVACEFYITVDVSQYTFLPSGLLDLNACQLLDQKMSELTQTFCLLIKRCDYLLKEANLTPKYDHDATLYAVAKMAINGDISTSTPHCWQGGSLFAKSMVDGMRLPIACSDWFVTVDELPEAIGDTLDELLNRLEQSAVVEPSDPPVSSEENQLPSKPEPPQPKRYRKKPAVPAEKTAEEIAFGFLLLWHEYDTKTFHCDPIPPMTKFVLWMTEKNAGKPGPSTSAVSRMLKDKFADKEKNNGHAKYLNACGNGTLEKKLALGKGEANRVFQELQQRERSTTDPELDLD